MRLPGTLHPDFGCGDTIVVALVVVLVTLTVVHADEIEDVSKIQRRDKCTYLWQRYAPWSYSPDLCEFFIAEHERLGIGDEWLSSFVYGFANFGLTLGREAPGLCFGPMDVKWGGYAKSVGCKKPDELRNPRQNIRAHCLEASVGRSRGHSGVALCKYIMFPARPHDWGGGKFRKTWEKMRRSLSEGYRVGKISDTVVD